MPRFISQEKVPTLNPKTESRIRYLDSDAALHKEAVAVMQRYFRSDPGGTGVTLDVLESIGEQRLSKIAASQGRTVFAAKQDVGIWVAVLLTRQFGADKVETSRTLKSDGKWRNAVSPVPKDRHQLAWVGNYTQHRVTAGGRGGFVEPSSWLRKQIRHATRRESPLGIYDVWSILLSAIPDDASRSAAMDFAMCLAKQATWTPNRDIQDALQAKLRQLDDSPFSPEAKARAAHLWHAHVETDSPPGLGRFVAFHRSWHAFEGKGGELLAFLLSLKRINAAPTGQDSKSIAFDLAHRNELPFHGMSRFSECLHLARPTMFPILNSQQMFVMGQILGFEDEDAFTSREAYMAELERILEVQRRLGLPSTNALDRVLLALANLRELDGRAYIEELDRFPM